MLKRIMESLCAQILFHCKKKNRNNILRVCITAASFLFLFFLGSFNLESPSTRDKSKRICNSQMPPKLAKTAFSHHAAEYQNFSDNHQLFISSLSFSENTWHFLSYWNQSETNKSLPSFHSNRQTTQKHSEYSNSCLGLISNSF